MLPSRSIVGAKSGLSLVVLANYLAVHANSSGLPSPTVDMRLSPIVMEVGGGYIRHL